MFYLIRFSIFIMICYLLIFLISILIKIGLNIIETSLGLIYIYLPDLFLFDILIKFMVKKDKIISLWWFVCFEYIMSCSGMFLSQDGIFQCFVECSKKISCRQLYWQPLVNASLIPQCQENVISCNFQANALG